MLCVLAGPIGLSAVVSAKAMGASEVLVTGKHGCVVAVGVVVVVVVVIVFVLFCHVLNCSLSYQDKM